MLFSPTCSLSHWEGFRLTHSEHSGHFLCVCSINTFIFMLFRPQQNTQFARPCDILKRTQYPRTRLQKEMIFIHKPRPKITKTVWSLEARMNKRRREVWAGCTLDPEILSLDYKKLHKLNN